jgi:acyl carrier protein
VRDAVVLAREDQPGDNRLVAYLTTAEGSVTGGELRAFLAARLPSYMMPAAVVVLERFPLTPSGKIDRRALPLPEPTRPQSEQGFVAPRTPGEEIVASIFAYVLGLERVGIHDNFFELGGHSLKATQVVSRLHAALQIELPLRTLFEAPTVAGIVAAIAQSHERDAAQIGLAQILAEVENLSEEETHRVLSQRQREGRGRKTANDV